MVSQEKIAIICCSNDPSYVQECQRYVNRLVVPNGMILEYLCVSDVNSMAEGYEEAMDASDARYKIYIREDSFLIQPTMLLEIVDFFEQHPEVGLVGVTGTISLPSDGMITHGERVGKLYGWEGKVDVLGEYLIQKGETMAIHVEAVEGYLMATQYDLPWRTDLCLGLEYCSVSQSLEFRKAGYEIAVLMQEKPWVLSDQFLQRIRSGIREEQKRMQQEYEEWLPTKQNFRILCPRNNLVAHDDIPWALQEMGHEVLICEEEVSMQKYSSTDVDYLSDYIAQNGVELVISHDFGQCVAEACYEQNIPYISWAFDTPLQELYSEQASYPINYVFSFDKKMIEQVKGNKIQHIYPMGLAANCNRVAGLIVTEEDESKYACDISMIGSLYDENVFSKVMNSCSRQSAEDILRWIENNVCIWDDVDRIHGILLDSTLEEVQQILITDAQKKYHMSNRFFYEVLLAEYMTNCERIQVLNHLAKKHQVYLYTGSNTANLKGVYCRGKTDYDIETPKIFHLSKINLNVTLRRIESGLPQRIYDIMAVGGLVMTNYQPEVEELFVPEQEIVVFHNLDELEEKADYYLKHERERLEIAMRGYRKVTEKYNYTVRLQEMIQKVQSEFGRRI